MPHKRFQHSPEGSRLPLGKDLPSTPHIDAFSEFELLRRMVGETSELNPLFWN